MFIELAEVLVCPACRSRHDEVALQGLVAVVGEIRDRRVRSGWLGCPGCEARYPIEEGTVRFGAPSPEPRGRSGGEPSSTEPPPASLRPGRDLALLAAALLSLHEVSGYVLLGPGLGTIAEELSRLAPGNEIIALCGREAGRVSEGTARVSRLSGVPEGSLPFRAASICAAAFLHLRADAIAEAARVLRPAARLAVLGPRAAHEDAEVLSVLRAAGLDPLAGDPRAIVAVRE